MIQHSADCTIPLCFKSYRTCTVIVSSVSWIYNSNGILLAAKLNLAIPLFLRDNRPMDGSSDPNAKLLHYLGSNTLWKQLSFEWLHKTGFHNVCYSFSWWFIMEHGPSNASSEDMMPTYWRTLFSLVYMRHLWVHWVIVVVDHLLRLMWFFLQRTALKAVVQLGMPWLIALASLATIHTAIRERLSKSLCTQTGTRLN